MPIQKQQWITVESVINDYLSESEQSIHKFFKLWHIAFRGMENMGLDFFYHVKSVKLSLNANKTANLPSDYLNYTKIGILNAGGGVVSLKYNDNLSSYASIMPDRIAETTSNNFSNYYSFSSPVFYNYWNGDSYSNFYGGAVNEMYGGGFKIDEVNGVILFQSNFGYTGLILEYVASPKEGEEYYVPVQFREALIAWIAWKDIQNIPSGRKGHLGDKRDRRHEFYNERRLAAARYTPFHLQEAYQLSLEATRLTVKT